MVAAGLNDTEIMRKYIGFAPDGATPTPLTDLGKQWLTASTSTSGPQSDPKVTEHVNNWLASVLGDEDVPDGLGTLHYRVPHPAHWRPLGSAWVQW